MVVLRLQNSRTNGHRIFRTEEKTITSDLLTCLSSFHYDGLLLGLSEIYTRYEYFYLYEVEHQQSIVPILIKLQK